MNIKKTFSLILLLFILFNCSNQKKEITIQTNLNQKNKPLTLKFKLGNEYSHLVKMGIFKLKITPQMAVWIEDREGNYLETLYVTKAFAKQKWMAVKYDPDQTLRGTSLPYWMNKLIKTGKQPPTKNNPLPDSVTSATPKSDFQLVTSVNPLLDNIKIMVEYNKSFDGNQPIPKKMKELTEEIANGQPSVIYSANIYLSTLTGPVALNPIGHGGNTGDDGNLYSELTGLNTALEMFESITVE